MMDIWINIRICFNVIRCRPREENCVSKNRKKREKQRERKEEGDGRCWNREKENEGREAGLGLD